MSQTISDVFVEYLVQAGVQRIYSIVGDSLNPVVDKASIEYDDPYAVGLTGLIGGKAAYHAMHACDLLLLLGTDFPYEAFLPPAACAVHRSRSGPGSCTGRRHQSRRLEDRTGRQVQGPHGDPIVAIDFGPGRRRRC